MRRHTEALQAETVTEVAPGGKPDVEVDYVAITGAAGETLVEQSADAELLVVGSRGLGRVARAVLGSVSDYLLRHARCPVLVVRLHPEHPRGHVASTELAGRV
jgi:nucleotide-binding universal stress UspA family protein